MRNARLRDTSLQRANEHESVSSVSLTWHLNYTQNVPRTTPTFPANDETSLPVSRFVGYIGSTLFNRFRGVVYLRVFFHAQECT